MPLNKIPLYPPQQWIDLAAAAAPGAVSSVFGRTGAVAATLGDYTAALVSNTPAGGIAATTVQDAIDELDSEKAAASHTHGSAGLDNDSVTYAKMQNVSAASRLIGRGSAGGAGDPEEITLGSGLSMSGTTLSASGGSGVSAGKAYAVARGFFIQ